MKLGKKALPDVKVTEAVARSTFPIVSITKCKSMYVNVHRIAGPKAPSEKRLIVNLIAPRKVVYEEAAFWNNRIAGGKTFRWIPTNLHAAAVLTKVIYDVKAWLISIRTICSRTSGNVQA